PMPSRTAPGAARTPDDLAGWDPTARLGMPGEFPFTRGIQPTMYRGRLWTMRQYAGFGTAEESNARYRYLLAHGVDGLSVAFDLPTQMGYDSDHPLAAGEVGKVGVAIDTIEDMAALFDRIPLDRVSTSMTINATAIILLALYVAVARRQGVAPAALSGTVQHDILKEYIPRGAAAVGAHHARAVPRVESARPAAPIPHTDGWQHAHRPAARQQHRPRRAAGAGGGARRHAVAPLQRPRRGALASDGGGRAD